MSVLTAHANFELPIFQNFLEIGPSIVYVFKTLVSPWTIITQKIVDAYSWAPSPQSPHHHQHPNSVCKEYCRHLCCICHSIWALSMLVVVKVVVVLNATNCDKSP